MNPEEVLEKVRAWRENQLSRGADPEVVDRIADEQIAMNTDYPNFFALRMAVESSEDFVRAQELEEIGGNPLKVARSVGEGLLQGISWNAVDEALAGSSTPALSRLGRGMGRRQERREELTPGAAVASEIAGGLMIPGGIARQGAAVQGPGILRSAARGTAQGIGGGALGGGVTGFFATSPESDDPDERFAERLEGARTGATFGAAGGGLFGMAAGTVAGAIGGRAGRATRLGNELIERSGREIDDASKVNVKAGIRQARNQIQEEMYQPLDRMFPEIEDPVIQDIIRRAGGDPSLRSRVFSNASNIRGMRPGQQRLAGQRGSRGAQVTLPEMAQRPSFSNLQDLRSRLREVGYGADGSIENANAVALYRELSDQMEDVLGPDFATANRAWRRTHRMEEAVERGWRRWDSPFEDLVEETRDFADDPEVLESFRRGRLARWRSQLSRSPDETMNRIQNAVSEEGSDRRAAFAEMFPGGQDSEDFQEFVRVATVEMDAERRAELMRRMLQSVGVGLAGGVAGGAIGSRGSGGN